MLHLKLKCLVCESTSIKELRAMDPIYSLAECSSCGFAFVLPRPSVNQLEDFYNSDNDYIFKPKPISKQKAVSSVLEVHRNIRTLNSDAKTVLDIGCAHGTAIYGLKLLGYKVVGTDMSRAPCDFALQHYGLTVHNSEFPPYKSLNRFDVILLSHVIEHVFEPGRFLECVAKYLKSGGLVFIGTPNILCVLFDIFGVNFDMIRPPEHISLFGPDSIRVLLRKSGFETLRLDTKSRV